MGWFRDPARHALAAKGIQTRIGRAQLDLVEHGNRPASTFMRASRYGQFARSLENRYSEGDTISEEDYERAVAPLFEALASADLLVDRGDLKGAMRHLDVAEKEYSALCGHANIMNDADAKQFTEATRMISQKAISRSRMPAPSKAPVVVVQSQSAEKPRADEHNSDSR